MKIPDTEKAISDNIARLYHKGFTNIKQAVAISYSEAGEGRSGGTGHGRGGHHGGQHRSTQHGHRTSKK
jgi:hypothetical protein